MSLDRIIKKINSYNCNFVEITGGEPLIQDNTKSLINMLIKDKFRVLLETNGSRSIADINPACIKIIDIKCPSSNESTSFLFENINHLKSEDEVKFVISSREDYEFAKSIIHYDLNKNGAIKIHLSPVFGRIKPEELASWILEDNLNARLSLQLHKIIWDPEKRGV